MRHQSHHDKFGSGTEKIRSVLASVLMAIVVAGVAVSTAWSQSLNWEGRMVYSSLRWPILSQPGQPRSVCR